MPTISGTVRDDNGDLAADIVVRAYRRDTGALLGEVLSGDGSTAVPGDPDFDSVTLLLHMDGADGSTTFTDSSGTPKTVTAYGNAQIKTAQSMFGGASGYFDGTGDYLSVTSTAFNVGLNALTCEAWVYPTTINSSHHIFDTRTSDADGFSMGINSSGQLFLFANAAFRVAAGTVPLNQWSHMALTVESNGDVKCWLNGQQIGSTWAKGAYSLTQTTLLIGKYYGGTQYNFFGYFDEVRITAAARYTANFTPPDAAFPNTTQRTGGPLGEYELTTSYEDEVNVIALDPAGGEPFNDLILRTTPV